LVKIVKALEYIPFTIGVTPTSVSFKVAEALLSVGTTPQNL
jgi:hypothetical protein